MSIKLELTQEQAHAILQVAGKLLDATMCPLTVAIVEGAAQAKEQKPVAKRTRQRKPKVKEEIIIELPKPEKKRNRRKKNTYWNEASLRAPD